MTTPTETKALVERLREALERVKALADGAIGNAHDLTPRTTGAVLEQIARITRAALTGEPGHGG